MKKSALFLVIFTSTAFLLAINARAVNAVAKLTLSPTSGSYSVDDTFKVTVGVDSGTETAGAVDGVGTYDSAKLELTDISQASDLVFVSGGSLGACSTKKDAVGKFSFTCYSNDSVDDKVIKGNLVVLTFRAKTTGTANVSFTCANGSTTDSNIIKSATATDIITCSSNDSGSYTIDASSDGDSSGEEDTTEPTATRTTTSSELPKTGGIGSTIGLISFGLVSVLGALFLKFL
jgi:hypothetical protein